MTGFLNKLPVYGLGRKFLIVTKKALVENFIKAVSFMEIQFIVDIYPLIAFLSLFISINFPLVNI